MVDKHDDRYTRLKASMKLTSLSVADLISIIWSDGTKISKDQLSAKRTLKEYGQKALETEHDPEQLAALANISVGEAWQVLAGLELGRRFYATKPTGRPKAVRTTKHAYTYLKDIGQSSREQFRVLYLNKNYAIIHDEVLAIGNSVLNNITPADVFQPAIEHGATSVVLSHNHPDGNNEPTMDDISTVEFMIKAGQLLNIAVNDFIVITASQHSSVLDFINKRYNKSPDAWKELLDSELLDDDILLSN